MKVTAEQPQVSDDLGGVAVALVIRSLSVRVERDRPQDAVPAPIEHSVVSGSAQ
jgi:hypothetical protein